MIHNRVYNSFNLRRFDTMMSSSLVITILCITLLFLLTVYHTDSPESGSSNTDDRYTDGFGSFEYKTYDKGKRMASDADYQSDGLRDSLIFRIKDLKRIKQSVADEVKSIADERSKLLEEKTNLIARNERLLQQISRTKLQLKQVILDLSSSKKRKYEQLCDTEQVSPIVFKPMKSVNLESDYNLGSDTKTGYTSKFGQRSQYDLSKCPLTKEFRFHLVDESQVDNSTTSASLNASPIDVAKDILRAHPQHTNRFDHACLLVVLIYGHNQSQTITDGFNYLFIDLVGHSVDTQISQGSIGAIAGPVFTESVTMRPNFDILLPSFWNLLDNYDSTVQSTPTLSPIYRKYLASYFGTGLRENHKNDTIESNTRETFATSTLTGKEKVLQMIHRNSIDDLFQFVYESGPIASGQTRALIARSMQSSTFVIILNPLDGVLPITNERSNYLIVLALSRGTIPVIIGRLRLPFDEVIDWRRAAIVLDSARLPEVHFILRSISHSDIYQLKYHGKRIFDSYLATTKQVLDTTIGLVSINRFQFPPEPVRDLETINYLNIDVNRSDQVDQPIVDSNCSSEVCMEVQAEYKTSLLTHEILGPRESPLASAKFRRNFSLILNHGYDLWNNPLLSPFEMFPSLPVDPTAPSEFKFLDSHQNYRPIGDGLGGSGYEFTKDLGGDYPNEQFTIVLLTYEREKILLKTLTRLKGLPYLNKILVVWNGVRRKPSTSIIWPDVGVPIKIVKVGRNSLNNRFLPYDEIETDAILSLDDDSPLRQDEIVFAFRVWRQSRDTIVGFPGRYHSWDRLQNSWTYNSNHSCELSMVLTGGAFFHRYYNYLYTFRMPHAIREVVDKFMNCEDIAMNFLVAHLTRKPPIKVTSRWTFHCPSCTSSLSEEDSHFRERHECLNIFASIYGYMPLMMTQHRSDSILFKTRLPQDKQKCFKYV